MFSYRPGVLDLTPRLKADIAKEMKPSKRPPRRARQQEKPRASASLSAHNALIAQLTGFAFGMPRAPGASFPGGPPPSTLETKAAFRWADADADGSLSLGEFLAAQVVSRELNEQWEGRQAAEGKLLVEQRRARHTANSRGRALTKAELVLEQQLALEEQQPSGWPAEQGRPSLLLPSSSLPLASPKWRRKQGGTFGSASHSTPTFSFNPVLRPPVK